MFGSLCHTALICGAAPKFSAKNLVNVTLCQDYLSALADLTLTEECVIARCHPLGVIVKLRPGGRRSSISHRALLSLRVWRARNSYSCPSGRSNAAGVEKKIKNEGQGTHLAAYRVCWEAQKKVREVSQTASLGLGRSQPC